MNRERKAGETFKQYRENLKGEAADQKIRLGGWFVHVSKTFTPDGRMNPGVTYRKPK